MVIKMSVSILTDTKGKSRSYCLIANGAAISITKKQADHLIRCLTLVLTEQNKDLLPGYSHKIFE